MAVDNDARGGHARDWAATGGSVVLPPGLALVSGPAGVVVKATEQIAHLAGEVSAEALAGQRMQDLLVRDGSVLRLRGGRTVVRATSWPHEADDRLQVTVLVDVTDLVPAARRGMCDIEIRVC